jgi:ribose transport system substrate-binding protein
VYDSDADDYTQLTQIEKARADGAKGLIVCPLNSELLASPLTSAQEAGLPLVILHSDMPSYGGVLLAGDDYLMGLRAGRFAGQIVANEMDGQADVIILDYPDLPILVVRADGLEDGLHEFAPEANVIGRYKGGTPEFGKASVEKLIQDGVTFDVILSINDAGVFGAIDAMEAADIDPGAVIASSVDAEVLAQQYIRDGYFMRGSVTVGREEFSQAAVNAMVKLLAGSTLPETYLVPPGEVVTRETLVVQGE